MRFLWHANDYYRLEEKMNKKDLEKLIGHKRHKFGAVAVKCRLGHNHPSKAEAMHCWSLQAQKNQGLIMDIEYEKPYDLIVHGVKVGTHKPDFSFKRPVHIHTPTGRNAFVATTSDQFKICVDEVKGFSTADWIFKSKLFQALYPDIEYRVIKST